MNNTKDKTEPSLVSFEEKLVTCPKKIGPYKIESLFSKGGMSYLYLGINESGEPLIVKVISPSFVEHKETVDQFLKETHIIGITNHPNIVKLYGEGRWEGGLYIAMEFIQGISLRQFILYKSFSTRKALEIVLQVAYALCHLHTHGVIHRDLKPENILITESGDIKVIDFGIAQLLGEVSQSAHLVGTPTYMSPEQKERPSHISFSSDIFSLGVIAYELILGRLSHGMVQLNLLPQKLRTLLEKALKTDPKERYFDIVDFITDISEYLKNEEEEKRDISVEEVSTFLFPETIPNWTNFEIGLAREEVSFFYLDFFKVGENYLFFMGEPAKQDRFAPLKASFLKGALSQLLRMDKKNFNPLNLLNSLNDSCDREEFLFSLIYFNTAREEVSAIIGGYDGHWQIKNKNPIFFPSSNPPLGKDKSSNFLESVSNFSRGDFILFSSRGIKTIPAIFSSQLMAQKILENNRSEISLDSFQRTNVTFILREPEKSAF